MDKYIRRAGAALPLVLLTGLLVGQTNSAFAHDSGRGGDNRTATGCSGCHSSTATPTVAFGSGSGSLPTSVVADSVNTLTFTISGGPAVKAGLSVIASGGTLTTTSAESTIVTTGATVGELIHTAAATMTGGSKTYTFTWKAPATAGSVTLNGAGVSGNGIAGESADGAARTTASITVTGGAVVPLISGPSTGTVGAPVSFDSSTSTGTIVTRNWNFGDNGTTGVDATGVTATHTYATAGTFPVKLTLIDGAGASTSSTQSITISAVGTHLPPVAKAGGPYNGTVGIAVPFSSVGSSVDSGLTASYSWDFGDASALSTVASPSHTYATAKTYTVTLTVTDNGTPPAHTTVTTTAVIAAATTPTTTPGQVLYDAKCASCHGPKAGPAGVDGSVVGESAGDIREAIAEVPTMQSLSTLTSNEIYSISIYLKPDPKPSRGERLYNKYCAECHGPGGTGADEPAIVGASAALIKDEIINEPEMQYLKPLLEKEDAIQLIARFLGGAGVSRSDLRALADTSQTDDTFLNKKVVAGALDWLTLIGVGAWGYGRRRKK